MTTNTNGSRPPYQPNPETEHSHEFTVRINTYGHPEKTLVDTAKVVALSMHRAFHPGRWKLYDVDGREVIFDPLAHDGEHSADHQSAIVFLDP